VSSKSKKKAEAAGKFSSNKEAALYYASLGWKVFPFWWITDEGICACPQGLFCRSPGEHPIEACLQKGADA
jgi:hypothetical protein